MKVVFLSDIHGNLDALEAVADDLPEAPIYCLGDIVGYGANPNESIEWVKRRCVLSILGNHDHAVLTGDTSWFNPVAEKAILWTRNVLSDESRSYLLQLSPSHVISLNGLRLLMVHGSPRDPLNEYVDPFTHEHLFDFYLERYKVSAIAMGHTHVPYSWKSSKGVVFNPGAVGQPRSGDPRACYAVVEYDGESIKVEHRYVDYPIDKAAGKILEAGLPYFLAARLYNGI